MAIYGIDLYAKAYYGVDVPIQFTVQPFIANQFEHGELHITWSTPRQVSSPQSPGKSWSQLQLVRNLYGVPSFPTDGEVLLNVLNTAPVENYLDTGVPPGRFAYYAIFVLTTHDPWDSTHSYSIGDQVTYSGQNYIAILASQNQTPGTGSAWSATVNSTEWVFAGGAVGLSVADWQYSDFLYSNTPRAYKVNVVETTASNPEFNNHLWKFDRVFGFAFDIMKTENDALLRINDMQLTRDKYAWAIAEQMGIGEEVPDQPELRRLRIMDATKIAQQKGTIPGLETLIYDTTGWGATITQGYNLMLDIDQAAFAHPIPPTWDANTQYAANVLVQYSGVLYRSRTVTAGNIPSSSPTQWTTLTAPVADNPATAMQNQQTGGLSSWQSSGTTASSTALYTQLFGVSGPPPRNCLGLYNTSASAQAVSAFSVPSPVIGTWSSGSTYLIGAVVTYHSVNYICILNVLTAGTTPDVDTSHWHPYLPASTERLAQRYGVPIQRVRPWDYQREYRQGDRVSANGNIYEAIFPNMDDSPSGYRFDTRGWRWLGPEQTPYTVSLYYQRQAPTASTTAETYVEWFDSQDNRIGGLQGGRNFVPLYDPFEVDGSIGVTTEPSYPAVSSYGNAFPITWINQFGPWQVSNGVLSTTQPPTYYAGQLLYMSELAWGSSIGSGDPYEFAWVTFVQNSSNPNHEIGLIFRHNPTARTYWMMSPGNAALAPNLAGYMGRLTKNTYAADFSSVTITSVVTWNPLPLNTRVQLSANKTTNNYTGYYATASGVSTLLFNVTDSFSSTGVYFGVAERPMS